MTAHRRLSLQPPIPVPGRACAEAGGIPHGGERPGVFRPELDLGRPPARPDGGVVELGHVRLDGRQIVREPPAPARSAATSVGRLAIHRRDALPRTAVARATAATCAWARATASARVRSASAAAYARV